MRKAIAFLMTAVLMVAFGVSAGFAEAEDGLLRAAALYDISTMDVAQTTDNYLIPMNVFDRLFETRPVNGSRKWSRASAPTTVSAKTA